MILYYFLNLIVVTALFQLLFDQCMYVRKLLNGFVLARLIIP